MLLDQRGVLSIDEPVSKWVPGVFDDRVTARHLLGHTSGLTRFVDDEAYKAAKSQPLTHGEVLSLALAQGVNRPPGEHYRYSNTGYVLLSELIQQATGKNWQDVVRTEWITPFELQDTKLITASLTRADAVDPRLV